jgi:hypothetical protein
MRLVLLAIAVVAILNGTVAAQCGQCCGDCDGDGAVNINELITAVSKSLVGCSDATPTEAPTLTPTPANRCPFTFDDFGNLCSFRGRFNQGCGEELDSTVTSDGGQLIIRIDTNLSSPPEVQFAAVVDSPTSAHLTAWSSNNFQTTRVTAGQVELAANGEQLVIFPNDPPFMILGCNFVRYAGAYSGANMPTALRADVEWNASFDRVREWRARPIPDLGAAD